MTIPPIAYPALTRTDKHAKPVDESGKDIGVPKSHVGIGDVGRCFICCTGFGRFHRPPLNPLLPDSILFMCPFSRGSFVDLPRCSRVSFGAGHIYCDVRSRTRYAPHARSLAFHAPMVPALAKTADSPAHAHTASAPSHPSQTVRTLRACLQS
jgi:hypothetical protein